MHFYVVTMAFAFNTILCCDNITMYFLLIYFFVVTILFASDTLRCYLLLIFFYDVKILFALFELQREERHIPWTCPGASLGSP